jgi:hypothetical protein
MCRTLSLALLLLPLCVLQAQDAPKQEAPKQEAPKQGRGPQPPKNLKILKPEDLRSGVMMQYARALGVNCMHCHVQGDNASDDKPQKNTARMMIAMVNEINAKFPDGAAKAKVTCYTCHNGKVTPLTAPPPATPPAAQ